MDKLTPSIKASNGITEEIVHHSKTIEQIIETISNIADQINLLALNTSIEAARAGE